MAYLSGKDCAYVLVDGVDVATSNNAVSVTTEAVCPKRRPLGQAFKTAYLTGQVDSELTISGWLDSTTQAQLADMTGDAKVISVLYGGNTVGQPLAAFKTAYVTGSKLGVSEDDLDTYEPVLVTSDCKANIGKLIAPLAARTTAANTDATNADLGADAASGTAFLHVTALTLGGYTSCTVTVRHSDDDVTYSNHTSFTTTTAVGAQSLALASTIQQYVSVGWAWVGAGADQSITFAVGLAVD